MKDTKLVQTSRSNFSFSLEIFCNTCIVIKKLLANEIINLLEKMDNLLITKLKIENINRN